MDRVALIQARTDDAPVSGQGVAPPLGLMLLAAAARERFPGRYVFEVGDKFFLDDAALERWLLKLQPRVVALSGMTIQAAGMRRVARLVQRALGDDPAVIVGGAHASSYPEDCLSFPGVDAVVRGEGELPFLDYLEHLQGARRLEDVRGILRCGDGGAVVTNPEAPVPEDLDALAWPAYDLVDLDAYERAPNTMATITLPPHRYVAIHSSRGCPYACTFCHNLFGRRFRAESMERVLHQLEVLTKRYRVRHVHVYDDIFNARKERIFGLARGVAKRRLDVRFFFINGLRTDSLDRAQIEALRDAGTAYFGAAIESAAPRVQKLLRKRMNVEKVLENVALADELGIFVNGFMMLGIPGETREEMELTIRTAELSRLHYVYFSVANPYRDTEMGRQLAAEGFDIAPGEMVGYSSPGKNFAGVPEAEFRGLIRDAYHRFWTPRRLLRFVANHPTPDELAVAVATPGTMFNLARRVRHVLGLARASHGSAETAWRGGAALPATVGSVLGRQGTAVQWAAQRLVHTLPSRDPVPRELKGRIASRSEAS